MSDTTAADLEPTGDPFIDEVRKARKELHEERRWRRWTLSVIAGVAVFALLVALANVIALVQLFKIADTNRESGRILVDCTSPNGECAQQGAQRGVELSCSIVNGVREALNLPPLTELEIGDSKVPCE